MTEQVLRKVAEFSRQMEAHHYNPRLINAGFWVRRIRNTPYSKFRLNSGDRILFAFTNDIPGLKDRQPNTLYFVRFCRHDDQINHARRRQLPTGGLEILTTGYQPAEDEDAKDVTTLADIPDGEKVIYKSFENAGQDNRIAEWIREGAFLYQPNDEQRNVLRMDENIILSGGAGSGKTMLGIYKLMAYHDEKVAYFTYNAWLAIWARQLYELNTPDINPNIKFWNINDFWEERAGDREIAGYRLFEEWYHNHCHRNKFPAREVWQEIHGVIKGRLGHNAIRLRNMPVNILSRRGRQRLLNEQFIRVEGNRMIFLPERLPALHDFLQNETALNDRDIRTLLRIANGNFLPEKAMDQATYLELNERHSPIPRAHRPAFFDIYRQYDRWLENNNYMDENDLARELLNEGTLHGHFQAIVMDEIQDLSELQIWALSALSGDRKQLFLAGDVHQIIQPTIYNPGLINNIFTTYNNRLRICELRDNYRSARRITELANNMVRVRRHFWGATPYDLSQQCFSDTEGDIFLLLEEAASMEKILKSIARRSYVSLIVPDQKVKDQYAELARQYNATLFTPQEIKGLEREVVIAFNLSGYWEKEYAAILNGRVERRWANRYLINMFYVGITRARNKLILWENNEIPSLLEHIDVPVEIVDSYDETRLGLLQVSTNEETLEDALELERRELYEQAERLYMRVQNDPRGVAGALRCGILNEVRAGNFSRAFTRARQTDKSLWLPQQLEFLNRNSKHLKAPLERVLWIIWHSEKRGRSLLDVINKLGVSINDIFNSKQVNEEEMEIFLEAVFIPQFASFKDNVQSSGIYVELIGEQIDEF